jgi:hypothetical protein
MTRCDQVNRTGNQGDRHLIEKIHQEARKVDRLNHHRTADESEFRPVNHRCFRRCCWTKDRNPGRSRPRRAGASGFRQIDRRLRPHRGMIGLCHLGVKTIYEKNRYRIVRESRGANRAALLSEAGQ